MLQNCYQDLRIHRWLPDRRNGGPAGRGEKGAWCRHVHREVWDSFQQGYVFRKTPSTSCFLEGCRGKGSISKEGNLSRPVAAFMEGTMKPGGHHRVWEWKMSSWRTRTSEEGGVAHTWRPAQAWRRPSVGGPDDEEREKIAGSRKFPPALHGTPTGTTTTWEHCNSCGLSEDVLLVF